MLHAILKRRNFLTGSLLLCSSILVSQVTIKETISIAPTAPTLVRSSAPVEGHTLRFEGVSDVPIFLRMFTSHCFGRTDTGTGSIIFEIPLTAGGYTFDFQPRVAELQPNQVCNVALTVKVDGVVAMQQSASFVGGSLDIFALWPGDYPSYGSPYNTTFALSVRDSILYEEGALVSIAGVNSCDEGLWDPASSVNLQITSGSNYAQFYDYNTRLAMGTSVNGTVQQIQDNYEVVADGAIPDSSGAFVNVVATSGGITQTATVKIKPYFFQVSADSLRIDYGSSTAIRVRSVDAAGRQYYRPVMPSVRVRIVDSLAYGTLWYGGNDSSSVRQIGDTLTNVTSLVNAGPFSGLETRFYANEQQPKDSIRVRIAVEKTGEGGMVDYYPPSVIPFTGRDMVKGSTQLTVVAQQSSGIARFVVKLSRDTLEYRQTADLTVIAVDKDSQEVAIDTSTSMMLTFDDGGPFADFIPFAGDTVETTLANISYGTLRSGTVKIVAAKKSVVPPPVIAAVSQQKLQIKPSYVSKILQGGDKPQFPKSQIMVAQVSDVTKVGAKYIILKPAIKVVAVQDSIKPFYPSSDGRTYLIDTTESRTKVKVAVTVSGILYTLPVPYSVKLTSTSVDSSGGHSHTVNRPTGYWGDSIKDTVKTKEFETGTDTLRTSYLASMFGGKERIIATLSDFVAIADTDTVVVRIPRLVLLEEEEDYDRSGGTDNHHGPRLDNLYPNSRTPDNNHWIDSSGEASLQDAAKIFRNAEWNTKHEKMKLNDISLPLGGGFDIFGEWRRDIKDEWKTRGHGSHRIGKDVDIENLSRLKQLKDAFSGKGWRFEDEGQTTQGTSKFPHFHHQ